MESQPASMPRSKQQRSELSTRRLLHAAAELIAERGYDRTTLALIGDRAGYSHGLVTQRFGSKEGLLIALVDYATGLWEQQRSAAEASNGGNGPEAVTSLIDRVRSNIERSPTVQRSLYALIFEAFKPIPGLKEHMYELQETTLRLLERDLRRGIAAGTIRKVNPKFYARYVLGVLRGAEYQWLLAPEDFDIDALLEWFAGHVRQSLEPDAAAGNGAVRRGRVTTAGAG